MQYGDLSNKLGSAIVINADLLFDIKEKWFGLRYELKFRLSSRALLENWFNQGDLALHIVCVGRYAEYRKQIEDMLNSFMVPYTNIIEIGTAGELNYLVSAEPVIGYFYFTETLVDIRTGNRKYYQVPNIAEIGYLLDGGDKVWKK